MNLIEQKIYFEIRNSKNLSSDHKSNQKYNFKEMFEARLVQGSLFKKIIEAIRELVTDANHECNESGISMQVSFYFMCGFQL